MLREGQKAETPKAKKKGSGEEDEEKLQRH
jgi:hypothetical protein